MNLNKFKNYLLVILVLATSNACFAMEAAPTESEAEPVKLTPRQKQAAIFQFLTTLNTERTSSDDLFSDSKKRKREKGFKKNIEYAVQDGFLSAIKKTTTDSSMEILKFIPAGFKGVTKGVATVFIKIFTGIRPLEWNNLALLNNKIYRLIMPFTQVGLGNLNREQRAATINAETNKDLNWLSIQKKVARELDHAILYLNKALVWYCPIERSEKASFISRYAINFSNTLTGTDLYGIAFYLKQAIYSVSQLKEILINANSFAEVQQKHDFSKRWLTMICDDLEQIAQLVEGEVPQKNSNKISFMRLSAGNSQKASLEDLLSGGNGMASLAGLQ